MHIEIIFVFDITFLNIFYGNAKLWFILTITEIIFKEEMLLTKLQCGKFTKKTNQIE